jgi:phage terminase large subunit-like protein
VQDVAQQLRDNLPEVIEQFNATLDSQRIYLYAKSLTLPWDEANKIPDMGDGRLWEQDLGKYGKLSLPYAHYRQRLMTYPVDNAAQLWKFVNAIYYCAFAGNQFGKSVWMATWVVMECLGIHPLQVLTWRQALEICGIKIDDLKDRTFTDIDSTIRPKPPVHWWVVGTQLPVESKIEGGEDTALVKTFYEWTPKSEMKFYRKDKIMTVGKSVINWKSHDQESAKLKGERLDGIGWDEEPPKSFWNEGRPRIIKKKGIFLLAMTSDYGSWTGEIRRQKNNPEYYMGEFDSLDNPFMPEAYRKKVFSTMNEQELFMRRFGKDISFKGKVFPFEWETHVKKPYDVSNDNVSYVIIDWHPAKPIVVTYLQINPQNIWYTWDESVIDDHVVGVVAQAIRSKLSKPGFVVRVKKFIIDKIAMMEQVQDSGQKAKDIVQMFREFGIYCELGNPSFGPAHTFLCDKMKHREWYVDPSCSLHIEQFDTWGAKRYQKGNLEGTLRDQLEVEGNDTCINHVYAYNSGAKFLDALWEEKADLEYVHPRSNRSSRLYGRA